MSINHSMLFNSICTVSCRSPTCNLYNSLFRWHIQLRTGNGRTLMVLLVSVSGIQTKGLNVFDNDYCIAKLKETCCYTYCQNAQKRNYDVRGLLSQYLTGGIHRIPLNSSPPRAPSPPFHLPLSRTCLFNTKGAFDWPYSIYSGKKIKKFQNSLLIHRTIKYLVKGNDWGTRKTQLICCFSNLAGIVTNKTEQSFYSVYSYSRIHL